MKGNCECAYLIGQKTKADIKMYTEGKRDGRV